MRRSLLRGVATIAALSLLIPAPVFAQAPPAPPPAVQTPATQPGVLYNTEQLDAMVAQIALYPDNLLAQILMAATYPLEIVQAARWLEQGNNKALSGEALAQAMQPQSWDPSVKSLVPFPQVLGMLNSNLDWTQQLGYAFANQQNDVWNSVQRLRAQAQTAGQLKTTEQQVVAVQSGSITIQPADPQVVYVPAYNPTVVYGAWPYPSSPPVYYPPPPLYPYGAALATGIAFAAGVAVVGSLWGWCNPGWHGGYGGWGGSVNVNANRYNNINVNRPPLPPGGWHAPPGGGPGGRPGRPPGGPVGAPGRPGQLPANAIGRPNVQVPGNLARPGGPGGAGRPGNVAGPGQRPGGPGNVAGPGQRPGGPGMGPSQRPAGPGAANIQRPSQQPRGAFGGVNDGARAGQFGQRGAQSRGVQQQNRSFQQNRSGGAQMRSAPSGGGGGARAGGGGRGGGGGGGRGGRR